MSSGKGDGPSSETRAFRDEVRAWIADHKPAPADFTLPQSFLEVETREQFDYLRAWQRALYEAGYLGFDVPEEYGGQGIDRTKHVIVMRELVAARAPFLVNTIGLKWVAPTILTFGTEEQKMRLLEPILSTDHIWCQGFSEPGAGSDLASLRTKAERQPDGSYRVTGHKVWTTIAHFADFMILLARTDPEANKYAGLSYFLFPMGGEGIAIQPLTKMSGEGGFNQVLFDEAPMPADALLGEEGKGWEIAMATLTFERGAAGISGEATAASANLLERLVELARTEEPSAADRDQLAQLWLETEAARFGEMRGRVAGLIADRPLALPMMSKLIRSEIDQRMAALGCSIAGRGAALSAADDDAPDGGEWPRRFMNSFGFTIGGGTSEIQRNLLAERVLGLPRSR
ncbi:MAG TPA: acyl-CoA dehydrogenase [Polyangiaceae bacterium]|nr:acyl-CoA dehydrogenase [Polyangiaceae bacterium]